MPATEHLGVAPRTGHSTARSGGGAFARAGSPGSAPSSPGVVWALDRFGTGSAAVAGLAALVVLLGWPGDGATG